MLSCSHCAEKHTLRFRDYEVPESLDPEQLLVKSGAYQEMADLISHIYGAHYMTRRGMAHWWPLFANNEGGFSCPLCDWQSEGYFLLCAAHIVREHGGLEPFEALLLLRDIAG